MPFPKRRKERENVFCFCGSKEYVDQKYVGHHIELFCFLSFFVDP
jgi:hypothetical protein